MKLLSEWFGIFSQKRFPHSWYSGIHFPDERYQYRPPFLSCPFSVLSCPFPLLTSIDSFQCLHHRVPMRIEVSLYTWSQQWNHSRTERERLSERRKLERYVEFYIQLGYLYLRNLYRKWYENQCHQAKYSTLRKGCGKLKKTRMQLVLWSRYMIGN